MSPQPSPGKQSSPGTGKIATNWRQHWRPRGFHGAHYIIPRPGDSRISARLFAQKVYSRTGKAAAGTSRASPAPRRLPLSPDAVCGESEVESNVRGHGIRIRGPTIETDPRDLLFSRMRRCWLEAKGSRLKSRVIRCVTGIREDDRGRVEIVGFLFVERNTGKYVNGSSILARNSCALSSCTHYESPFTLSAKWDLDTLFLAYNKTKVSVLTQVFSCLSLPGWK